MWVHGIYVTEGSPIQPGERVAVVASEAGVKNVDATLDGVVTAVLARPRDSIKSGAPLFVVQATDEAIAVRKAQPHEGPEGPTQSSDGSAHGNIIKIAVPDIGEFRNIPVLDILVKPGDTVHRDDSIVTLESDKATMDVPATADGIVREVRVKLGDRVSQGSVLVLLTDDPSSIVPLMPDDDVAPTIYELPPAPPDMSHYEFHGLPAEPERWFSAMRLFPAFIDYVFHVHQTLRAKNGEEPLSLAWRGTIARNFIELGAPVTMGPEPAHRRIVTRKLAESRTAISGNRYEYLISLPTNGPAYVVFGEVGHDLRPVSATLRKAGGFLGMKFVDVPASAEETSAMLEFAKTVELFHH